jgi:hypothetical protein
MENPAFFLGKRLAARTHQVRCPPFSFPTFRMNSDSPPPASTPANPPSASPRTSNLKSRWKRAPSVGAVAQKASTPAVCGEVTDVAGARESLSGQHVKGYERPDAPPPRPVSAAAPMTTPAAARKPDAPAPRVESSNETRWSEPPQYESRPRAKAAPIRQTPPPPPRTEAAPISRPAPCDYPSAPPRSREFAAEPRREAPAPRPREISSEPRREAPAPQRPPSNRPPQDERGGRDHYVALKPDPADAAPRRLRTEAARPVPVQEYTPSALGRAPDKSVPVKRERESSRREPAAKSNESVKLKPNATISAHVASSKDAPKAKSRGILGFIKRIFTGDPMPAKTREPAPRDSEDDSRDERRSGRDEGRSDDSGRHRGHHRRHSHDQPRSDSRGERRGDRRPESR